MTLRKLKEKDAPLMLEWMHDESVVADLKANFAEKTLEDCLGFIAHARQTQEDIHFAAVDDKDEYMGTVSLKHIHRTEGWAEFAIVVRIAAMGKGISRDAMNAMVHYGVEELGLSQIYWCVNRDNTRAVRFYDKNGYERTAQIPEKLAELYREEGDELLWYAYPAFRWV